MLAKRIIPTMLLRGTALYKGRQFSSWRQVGHVMQSIRTYQKRSVDELLLLDVQATLKGRGPDFKLIQEITDEVFSPITVGGGVRDMADVERLLEVGADKVAICTAIAEDEALLPALAKRFGSQAIVAVIELRESATQWNCSTHCGKKDLYKHPVVLAKELEDSGAGEILLNSVSRDGMMQGYDIEILRRISSDVSIPVVISGGAGSYEHMHQAILAGADGVAAGAMFHFTDSTPQGAAQYLASKGVEVRT